MKKILVTGGDGLVGSYLKKDLPKAIYISSKDFNLTIQKDVEDMFLLHNPDTVIHLASRVGGIIDNIEHPTLYLDDNVLMNTFVLKYAHKYGVKRFTAILSSCAFPEKCEIYPMKEEVMHDGPPDSNTFSYGLSKRVMAVQIENYNKEFNTEYNFITPCNLYGVNDKVSENKSHFITSLINKIKKANENGENFIHLFGDGSPVRQLLHAKDLSGIIKNIIDKDITSSFNVATEESLSIDEISNIALMATDSKHISIIYNNEKPNGQNKKDLDIMRFKELLPDYKCVSLFDGLKEYYKIISNE